MKENRKRKLVGKTEMNIEMSLSNAQKLFDSDRQEHGSNIFCQLYPEYFAIQKNWETTKMFLAKNT